MINKNDIISELKYCYSNDELNKIFNGISIDNVEENHLRNFFNEHCKKNKITMKISDVFKKLKNKNFAIDTPDGYQLIGDFYLKGPDKFYKIETYDGFKTKCIGSHMFETDEGWKYARDITKNDLLLTKNGYIQVKKISLYNYIDDAYDFEVLHDNHRYWSGNGISSHNSGKTFLALSICREAQKKGYTPIYMDSEGSIDKAFVERLGIDTKNFIIMQVNTISEVSTFISNLLLKINKDQKIILVLDSLGNLTSDKEKDDIINATGKRDMSKQQEIKALFRTNMVGLAKAHIPFIVNSHVYQTMDLFAKNIVSGGSGIAFNSSITMMLSASKMDDKVSEDAMKKTGAEGTKVGVIVTAKPEKSRFCKPIKTKFYIPFYKSPNPYIGLEPYLTWENSGIVRGKLYNEKEYNKLKDSEKEQCKEFEFNGEKMYALPKDTARGIVVKHLGSEISLVELFTPKVFTDELLHKLDDEVIKPIFQLPNVNEIDDLKEMESEIEFNNDTSEDS